MKSILLPLVFLFQFSSILLISSAYTLPDKYFINCGSDTDINSVDRVFTGDMNSSSVSFTKQGSSQVLDRNQVAGQASTTIYQTARVFRQPSLYEFQITNTSTTYLVRLHFFAFPSTTNLSKAVFNVSTSEEIQYLFRTSRVVFAFVNAIEVFPALGSFIPDTALHITSSGSNGNYYKEIVSKVLYTIHRINVGGLTLTEENDTLWRNWVPDDSYLYNSKTAKNGTSYAGKLNYMGRVNEYTAPDFVYRTSKQMNIVDGSQSNNFIITWNFSVSKNTSHFVRVHFCDTVSPMWNVLTFNLFIAGKFSKEINTYHEADQLYGPFYFDFVVDSDDSGILNISVGPNAKSEVENAILNGLEIMEIMEKSVSEAPVVNNGTKKGLVLVLVVSVLGGLVFIGVLAVFIFFGRKRYRKTNPGEPLDSWSALPVFGGGSTHSRVTEKSINGSNSLNLGLKVPFGEIQFATKNFDSKLVIGKGGFGTVYKGIFRNGVKVAVKRSQPGSGQGLSEFQTEIKVLSKIHNRHLVSLIGYCDERSEMILVYEFMEKGTLKDHLYDSKFPCLPAIDPLLPRDQVNLADWGKLCKNKGCLEDIVDPLIKDQINPNSLKKFAETFEKCLQEDSSDRPTMGDVLWDLEYALQLQQSPTKREPHEDSTTDASDVLTLPNVRRVPSLSESIVVEDSVLNSDSLNISESEVFSQLRIANAR
ncbi:hypothetical protein EZV62_013934 [Acer yangbiense]|uniref:Protein kinase domain-containing protein n=1 Tax=Acer yangbiense TaxID=1000413 RepID=A0A5C7HQP0_9ROSI|nr:hypothetical protein EZV62_013934 [Acer yangbiense]